MAERDTRKFSRVCKAFGAVIISLLHPLKSGSKRRLLEIYGFCCIFVLLESCLCTSQPKFNNHSTDNDRYKTYNLMMVIRLPRIRLAMSSL
jgi:hypothetical protein